MFRSGLLILTVPVTRILPNVSNILASAAELVNEILYIHFAPNLKVDASVTPGIPVINVTSAVKELVTTFYCYAASKHQSLDLRIIVGNIGQFATRPRPTFMKYNLQHPYDVLITNSPNHSIVDYAKKNFTAASQLHYKVIQIENVPEEDTVDTDLQAYEHTVLGGTFDRLHLGHKILLNEALLITKQRLVIGVTDGHMNAKKTLPELIELCEGRISALQCYLEDVKPQLLYDIVPILDPFGPSIVYPDLECIIVSEETLKGGKAVNQKRIEKGLSELDVAIIALIKDEHQQVGEEEKISSSSQRRRLLGSLLKPPRAVPDSGSPYIIGLTGGIASGKSSICSRLEGLGAVVVDCDKLGHQAYDKDGAAYPKMLEAFSQDILAEDGTINRRALGPIVFSDPELMQKLNDITWPVIRDLAQQQVNKYHEQGHRVVVLDAAVLLEAGWDNMTHEVWTTVIPQDEAVSRIMQRNKLNEADALSRVKAQMSNQERVDRANVVLCTLWDYSITQLQVEKAWKLLQERMPKQNSQL